MRVTRLQHKEWAGRDLSRSNTKRLWDSIHGMTNMDTKRKAVFANDEITKANDFYLHFESDNQGECRKRRLIVMCMGTEFESTLNQSLGFLNQCTLTKRQGQIIFLLFF